MSHESCAFCQLHQGKKQFERPNSAQCNPSFPIRVNLRHEEKSVRSRMKNKEKRMKKNETADLLTSMQKEETKKKDCLRTAIDCGFILDNLSCHARGTLSQLKVVSHESVESVLSVVTKSFGDSHTRVGHVAILCPSLEVCS